MPLLYATADDLDEFDPHTDVDPAIAPRLLRLASTVVGWAARADVYDAAPSGLPSEPELAEALRDATCAQVTYWSLNGIDPSTEGATQGPQTVTSKSRGGASVSYSAADPSVTSTRARATTELCPEALSIMRLAGFTTGQPWRA